jgi:hypothetical protein
MNVNKKVLALAHCSSSDTLLAAATAGAIVGFSRVSERWLAFGISKGISIGD